MNLEEALEKCQCERPGFCEVFQRPMTLRLWQLCSANCSKHAPCTHVMVEEYRDFFFRKYLDVDRQALLKPIRTFTRKDRLTLPCVRRGDEVGQQHCDNCFGNVRRKLFDCSLYGKVTVQDCLNCVDYLHDMASIKKRHLLYYIYPITSNGTWQRNLDQLKARWPLFNGRKIVAVALASRRTGHLLDPPEKVQEHLGCSDVEWMLVPGNVGLRETVCFKEQWQALEGEDRRGVTFYAHAKGVTHPVNAGVTVHSWTDVMYAACLDHWPLIERVLLTHAIAGCFQKHGVFFPRSCSRWHFSGTFYWCRNDAVFSRDWQRVDQNPWGNEAWPGLHFTEQESHCLFHPVRGDLYTMPYWQEVAKEFETWRQDHRRYRTSPNPSPIG